MEFRIADTFTDSLSRLTTDEQKAVKTTAFDLQLNPANPGMSFHKLDKARDKNFWSVRVNRDVRLIVHKTQSSFLLCYVDHHDDAYSWAERRKLEVHPTTGAAQLVEIRETLQEIIIPVYVQAELPLPQAKPLLFAKLDDEVLLSFGVPPEWLADVKRADEDSLLVLVDHLPSEAGEALLEIAVGGSPKPVLAEIVGDDPFEHPDAQRRFRTFKNVEEFTRALEFPWDKWAVFLHPDQRQLVEKDYSGPIRVSGSAGTGKTIVALHRAVALARKYPDARVLLTTFSDILANALRVRLRKLTSNEPHLSERIDVESIQKAGIRLYKSSIGIPILVTRNQLLDIIRNEVGINPTNFSDQFLLSEWEQVIDAWQITSWENYRDFKRLGRKTRLPEAQRKALWDIFSAVNIKLKSASMSTEANIFTALAEGYLKSKSTPYNFIIVDEAQDLSPYHLKLLVALGADKPNALFFAGDLGQRIFGQVFS